LALPASNIQDRSFPKTARLLHRQQFVSMSQTGHKFAGRHLILLVGEMSGECTRLGITVSKRVGCAVVRNRLKRLLREVYRISRETWPLADCVVIARSSAAKCSVADLHRDLLLLLKRVHGT